MIVVQGDIDDKCFYLPDGTVICKAAEPADKCSFINGIEMCLNESPYYKEENK